MTDASSTIVLQALAWDHPMVLSAAQQFLGAHIGVFEGLWWGIFWLSGATMFWFLFRSREKN